MEDLFRLSDFGHEHLTELTLDGLLTRLTETTWVRAGAVLGPEDRMAALAAQIPARLVVSHGTAWWVHVGLGRAPSPLTFTTHPRRRVLERSGVIIHELAVARSDLESIAGLPVTTRMRTLYDLLLPHVRAPGPDSEQAMDELVAEVPQSMRGQFRLYLDSVVRRPYAAQMREVFDRVCARPLGGRALGTRPRASTTEDASPGPQPPEMR